MANGIVVQFAVLSVSAALLVCALIMFRKRKSPPAPQDIPPVRPAVAQAPVLNVQPQPATLLAVEKPEVERQVTPSPIQEPVTIPAPLRNSATAAPMNSTAMEKSGTFVLDVQGAASKEDRNERILAGISENIKKSLQMRPVPQNSPIPYSEVKRNTEYVRVKKEIITPYGQVRFSILKDWMSTNMLAVFRRASLDWKSPEDLIAFLPAYLEPEAEILNNQVLLIGTPGHDEKLAVPIRTLDPESNLGDCFDFVSDGRAASNTPAVLLPQENSFEVVAKGMIPKAVFASAMEPNHGEALQERYTAALRQMNPSTVS
jgi:hypothetical protein